MDSGVSDGRPRGGSEERHPECASARDARDLADRIGARLQHAEDGVADSGARSPALSSREHKHSAMTVMTAVATSAATSRSSIASIASRSANVLDEMDALDGSDTRVTRLRAWSV